MKLAKPHVDVGLMARNADAMLAFWQADVGLPFEELLPTGRGNHQHRHAMNGSVLKLNASRDPAPETPPTGYRELWIAEEGIDVPRPLVDPDGNRVARVPVGHEGVTGIGLRLGVRSIEAHAKFFQEALGFETIDGATFSCGDSLFFLEADPEAGGDSTIVGSGYRYVTIQVFDCDAATAFALDHGASLGAPARTLGDVARFSMIRDPDGNWIELSQRRSLTGDLPA
jgi:lactoylglutathione lyase